MKFSEPVSISFGDLKEGDCIVSPEKRSLGGTEFDKGRMLQILRKDAVSAQVQIEMGRAVDYVDVSEKVIDSSHLPGWQRYLLPVSMQTRLLLEKLFDGATTPLKERTERRFR